MALKEELKQLSENAEKEMRQLYEKVKQRPLSCLICIIVIVTAVILLIALPHWQVSGINNVTEKVTQENQSRATLAQILGGIAVGIGIYFAWVNLVTAREGQITDRFTRAVDQLGNDKLEIRLGGIYALERIANESNKDYWSIMEILTAYVRKNSSVERITAKRNTRQEMDVQTNESTITKAQEVRKISLDVQIVLTVIGRCKNSFVEIKPLCLDLHETCLQRAKLVDARLEMADFTKAHLENANLNSAHLFGTSFMCAHLEGAFLRRADLEGAYLRNAHLEMADLEESYLSGSSFEMANFEEANLKGVYLEKTNLKGAKNLTVDQLSKVKTLYQAKIDPELEEELRLKGYSHLLDEKP